MVFNFIPVKFGVPGTAAEIHPDHYFGARDSSGTIMERWFLRHQRHKSEENPKRPDQGLSYVLSCDGEKFLF
ncbi:MAG: hypothetical protein V8Q57_08200 [Blautia sp.]